MHFFVLKENLEKALLITGRNISPKPQIPILSNILIKVQDNTLKICTTNLELGIIFTIPAKIEKEGEITVPGKLLCEFIANLKPGKIEFLLDGTNLIVKTDKTKASFTTVSAGDFPAFPQVKEIEHKFEYKKIKDAIMRVVFSASQDEERPVLTGLRMVFAKNKTTFMATDGYRLSIENIADVFGKEEFQMILPAKSVAEVMRISQETKSEEIGFSLISNKNQVVFSLGQVIVFTRMIDGEFPAVEKIIPDGFKTRVTVDCSELTRAVKSAAIFARTSSNIIKIKIEKEGLRIKAVTPSIGEDEDFIEAKMEGEETEVSFNFRFLLDLLSNFPEQEIVFETLGSLNPGIFKSSSPTLSYLHIIMPVRVQV